MSMPSLISRAVILTTLCLTPVSSWTVSNTFRRLTLYSQQQQDFVGTCDVQQSLLRLHRPSVTSRIVPVAMVAEDSTDCTVIALPESSLSRGDWLRAGLGLASIVPLVLGLGSAVENAVAASAGTGSVTVLGAGGKTGRECVEYLAARGTPVRAVARSLTNSNGEPLEFSAKEGVELGTADVTAPGTLADVVKGASAVIFASSASKQGGSAKAVDYEGVVNVAKACLAAKVPRLVVVSSGGVGTPNSSIYKFLNLFGEIMTWKIRGEDELRSMYAAQGAGASCHYTIVRPGGLTLDPPRGIAAVELNQGDTKSGRIARADVARVCVESIYSRAAEDCTLECYYKDTGKPLDDVGLSNILKQKTSERAESFGTERTGDTWEALFTGLKQDTG